MQQELTVHTQNTLADGGGEILTHHPKNPTSWAPLRQDCLWPIAARKKRSLISI